MNKIKTIFKLAFLTIYVSCVSTGFGMDFTQSWNFLKPTKPQHIDFSRSCSNKQFPLQEIPLQKIQTKQPNHNTIEKNVACFLLFIKDIPREGFITNTKTTQNMNVSSYIKEGYLVNEPDVAFRITETVSQNKRCQERPKTHCYRPKLVLFDRFSYFSVTSIKQSQNFTQKITTEIKCPQQIWSVQNKKYIRNNLVLNPIGGNPCNSFKSKLPLTVHPQEVWSQIKKFKKFSNGSAKLRFPGNYNQTYYENLNILSKGKEK